jgi:type II secretory pathway pseudopilin PulG
LIVVAIIGILAAIAIPQYNKYRQRAQDAVAVSAIDGIISAQNLYFTDHNQWATTYDSLADKSLTRDSNVAYGIITLVNGGADYAFELSHEAPGSTLFKYSSTFSTVKYQTSVSAGPVTNTWN